jgi:hypothetical protein
MKSGLFARFQGKKQKRPRSIRSSCRARNQGRSRDEAPGPALVVALHRDPVGEQKRVLDEAQPWAQDRDHVKNDISVFLFSSFSVDVRGLRDQQNALLVLAFLH